MSRVSFSRALALLFGGSVSKVKIEGVSDERNGGSKDRHRKATDLWRRGETEMIGVHHSELLLFSCRRIEAPRVHHGGGWAYTTQTGSSRPQSSSWSPGREDGLCKPLGIAFRISNTRDGVYARTMGDRGAV